MSSTVRALEPIRSVSHSGKPDRAQVEAAVRTIIIRWAGDDPERGGLIETPARVTRALEEAFAGYGQDPAAILEKSFDETEGCDEIIACAESVSRATANITWHLSSAGPGLPMFPAAT
jgi:GTP cyclohydrolase I